MGEQLEFDFGPGFEPNKKAGSTGGPCCPKCAETIEQLTAQLRAVLSELKEAKRLLSVRS